jgi:hypothetical protein
MADTCYRMKAATMADMRRHARRLAYLGAVDKITAALANEYGTYRKLPSRAFIEQVLFERNAPRRPYGGNQASGCEL